MKSNQLRGTFRGVPFGLFGHAMDSGRRVVTHEFPYRDTPYAEDLGLSARSFSLEMFVVGDDAPAQRDALRKALEQRGPGTLVHPYLGTLSVQVTSFTLSEDVSAQRLATFSVSFVQPGRLEFPAARVNAYGTVSAASTAASLYASSRAAAIDVRAPAAAASLRAQVDGVADSVRTSARRAAQPSSLPTEEERSAAIGRTSSFSRDLGRATQLIESADLMCFSLTDLVFRLQSLGMTPLRAFDVYRRLLTDLGVLFSALRHPATAVGVVMAANAGILRDAIQTAAIGSAAVAAVDADFPTLGRALEVRAELGRMFDAAMGEVQDDTLFGYLQDLRAETLTQVPPPGADLPSVTTVRTASALPSLALAHDLAGGVSGEASLLELNAVRNPWFVPGAAGDSVLVIR